MSLIVKKAGILDTFQDCGRIGFRRFGINPNGAMDRAAIRTANILLGNGECEAALEMHFPAPSFEFRRETGFVLAGADFDARLNSQPIPRCAVLTANKSDVLEFRKRRAGRRCYLSVKNGFTLDEWLGSVSTNLLASISGFKGRRIENGDRLTLTRPAIVSHSKRASPMLPPSPHSTIRFLPGPAFRDLTAMSKLELITGSFAIKNDSNRMGYRLEGPALHMLDEDERLSAGVTFGTIQVLPDKQLIILMADHQTSGGYPNIGTITEADLSVVAQLGPRDSIVFRQVGITEAENIVREAERDLALIKHALRLCGAWKS